MIPLFRPSCTEAEIEAVTRVLRSGWWALGPEVEAFEEEFAAYTGTRYAVAVSSGTMALELAARALGITNGTAIVPALTFVSTAQAMQHAGNRVLFADIDEGTLCIDWDDVADRYPPQPAVVVPVWYGGTVTSIPAEMWLRGPGDRFRVIEDCAHAAGSKMAGRQGEAAAWSFHAVKNLATGDGGMVTTDNREVATRLKQLRWCGIDRSTWDRDKDPSKGYGWNYSIPHDGEKAHMNDLTAALGRVQLRRLDVMNIHRRDIADYYTMRFGRLPWLDVPWRQHGSSHHLYVIRVDASIRDQVIAHLLSQGVSAGVHYKPLTRYPHLFPDAGSAPVAECIWQQLVTLPLYPDMTPFEIEHVIAMVESFGKRSTRA